MIANLRGNQSLYQFCIHQADWCRAKYQNDNYEREMCFIKHCMPPPSIEHAIPLSVGYAVILLTGFMGNIVVLVVSMSRNWLMNVTRAYLINLAISDLVSLFFGLSMEFLAIWVQYPFPLPAFFCHLKGLVSETTLMVSALTILAFTIERYLAICHSLFWRRRSSLYHRPILLLVCIWLLSAGFAIPYSMDHKEKFMVLIHCSAVCFFIAPMVVITMCYLHMAVTVSKSGNDIGRMRTSTINANNQHQQKTLYILALIVISFFLCYAPFHVQRVLFFYKLNNFRHINHYLYLISGVLFYASSTINPILYSLVSSNFRKTIHSWFKTIRLTKRGTRTIVRHQRQGFGLTKSQNKNPDIEAPDQFIPVVV